MGMLLFFLFITVFHFLWCDICRGCTNKFVFIHSENKICRPVNPCNNIFDLLSIKSTYDCSWPYCRYLNCVPILTIISNEITYCFLAIFLLVLQRKQPREDIASHFIVQHVHFLCSLKLGLQELGLWVIINCAEIILKLVLWHPTCCGGEKHLHIYIFEFLYFF